MALFNSIQNSLSGLIPQKHWELYGKNEGLINNQNFGSIPKSVTQPTVQPVVQPVLPVTAPQTQPIQTGLVSQTPIAPISSPVFDTAYYTQKASQLNKLPPATLAQVNAQFGHSGIWTSPDVQRTFMFSGLTPQTHWEQFGRGEGLMQPSQGLVDYTAQQAEAARQAQIAKELEAQTMAQTLAKLQMQQQEQARQQAQAQVQAQAPTLTYEQMLARNEEIRRQTAAQVAQYQQQQVLPQINIPQTIFPSSSSAAYSGLMPTELFQSLTPAITQAAAETQKYLTPEGRSAMEAETRTGLLRGFRPKYEGQITQSLGQLAERGLLGGTTQENILRGVTADLSQQYDKEILNRVQERVNNYLNMIGGIGGLLRGTVQTAQESNPLAPYQLWADLVKGWLGTGA